MVRNIPFAVVTVVAVAAALALAVAALVFGSKAGSAQSGTVAGPPPSPAESVPSDPTPTRSTPGLVASTEPVLGVDAPDPFLLVTAAGPTVFTTNTGAGNVPVVVGSRAPAADGGRFVDALPRLPSWAEAGSTWAPAVVAIDGGYVLAFSARHAASGRQCIGVATSATATGPYEPATEPLVCDLEVGGAIDPSFLTDGDGSVWLLYKDDGNCCARPTTIRIVALDPAGTQVAGAPIPLLVADQPWEGAVIEAPSMVAVDGRWLLLYSANDWNNAAYAVGAAWCEAPVGPCRKLPAPVLTSTDGLDGPGGLEVVPGSVRLGEPLVAFHAWPEGRVGYEEGSARQLHLGRVEVDGDTVVVVPVGRPTPAG